MILAEAAHGLQVVENTAGLTIVPIEAITEITPGMTGIAEVTETGGIKPLMKYLHGLVMKKQSAGVELIN